MYDIVVLAGQSNAEGTGLGEGPRYEPKKEILFLYDPQDNGFSFDEEGEPHLKVKRPFTFCIAPAKERFCDGEDRANFALWFAERYMEAGLLKEGRKLLIVNAAVGGTGFKRGHWGRGEILSERLYEMLDLALTDKGSRLVAFLWHQGEHDAFENMGLSHEELYARYRPSLDGFFQTVRGRYGKEFPVIAAGFSEQYRTQNEGYQIACDAVLAATKSVFAGLQNAAVIDSHDLLSNDQISGNGDKVHFCRSALYELGKRYFEKYLLLTKQCKAE